MDSYIYYSMDTKERLELSKLIKEYNAEDNTQKIRSLKHSKLIHHDVGTILNLRRKYPRIYQSNIEQFKTIAKKQAEFLFNNYTNIFNRLIKDELNLQILWKFLEVLQKIEEGELDQHEGSYQVGILLKQMYIDSVIQQDNKQAKRDKRNTNKQDNITVNNKNISWNEFKNLHYS